MPEIVQIAVDRRPVFHTHRQRNQAFGEVSANVFDAGGNRELLGMFRRKLLDNIDELFRGGLRLAFFLEFRRRVDRHERYVQTPCDGSWVVEIAVFGRFGNINRACQKAERNVDMRVDDDTRQGNAPAVSIVVRRLSCG